MAEDAAPHIHVPSVGSTLSEAWRLHALGQGIPFWLTADEQTHGRGRLDRQWVSQPGNLYATYLTSIAQAQSASLLPFAVSLAVYQAIRVSLPTSIRPQLGLKWPNDVQIAGAKTSGILIERRAIGSGPSLLAIGIGINVAHAPAIAGRQTTSLADHGTQANPRAVFAELRVALADRLRQLCDAPDALVPDWTQRAVGIGSALTVHIGNEQVEGTFDHLACDGALMLRLSSGAMRAIRTGDIAIKPLPAEAGHPSATLDPKKEPE